MRHIAKMIRSDFARTLAMVYLVVGWILFMAAPAIVAAAWWPPAVWLSLITIPLGVATALWAIN